MNRASGALPGLLRLLPLLAAGCSNAVVEEHDGGEPAGDAALPPVDALIPPDLAVKRDLGPCGGPCVAPTPLCDARSGRCVACLADKDCPAGALCHLGACTGGCSAQHGCGDAGVCELDAGMCVECRIDADCGKQPDNRLCDSLHGRCVPCRPQSDTCPAGRYCRDDGQGNVSCAPGCKDDGECRAGGGASAACCGHACVDTATSAAHCGKCGNDCGADPDAACCASTCVHKDRDVKACGGCGAGICQLGACNPGFDNCNGNPADGCEVGVGSDVTNCGACGVVCAVPNGVPACIVGVCGLGTCNPGFKNCDGMLANGCEINVGADIKNCGTCANDCGQLPHASADCKAGVCVVGGCAMGYGDCNKMGGDGCESPLDSDGKNCGACGNVCPTPPNIVAMCTAGKCTLGTCAQGFVDCNKNLADGCEAQVAVDTKNCGMCGTVCAGGANATAGCKNGGCALNCNQGFGDCDGNPGNGCETNVTADNANCGACGVKCGGNTPMCLMGVCSPACKNFTGVKSIAGPARLYGFCWYLGSTGSTCDVVCADLGGMNLANAAANSFPDHCNAPQPDDVSTWFYQNGNACSWTGSAGGTGYHTLGYGHINNGYFGKCAAGMTMGNGAFPGDTINLQTRCLVCPCFMQ